jgi:hypothetical protein
VTKGSAQNRSTIQQVLQRWQQNPDRASLRGDTLAKLPEAERKAWRQLWADVADTLARARGQATAEKPSDKKEQRS